jgi:hypothetical protein
MEKTVGREKIAFLKTLLKPGIRKVIVFSFFLVVVLLIPIYPIHTEKYVGYSFETTDELVGSSTTLESFTSILMNDFDWITSDVDVPPWYMNNIQSIYYRYTHSADPYYLVAYIPFIFCVYLISCYYIELGKRGKK